MALSPTDKMKLQAVLDQTAGLPLGFQGDRLAAVNYGVALFLKVCGPLLCLAGDEPPEPKPEEEPTPKE